MNINFASDNAAPVCPELMAALATENNGPRLGYGNDDTTRRMEDAFRTLFGCDLKAYPVATGTAANVLGLATMTPPYGSIYCHSGSHIQEDECGAPEFYSGGAKLALLDGDNGKIYPDTLSNALLSAGKGVVHHVQPAAISLTQITESGTVYTPEEVSKIGNIAKEHGLGLHMDGARFANAIASLNCHPADVTWKAGVDVLSFGGTKNGAMSVEAVIFFDMEKAVEFEFRRKRGAHLFSKQRYLSAQLEAYLENQLWLKLASQANAMARRLAEGLIKMTSFQPEFPVEGNIVFVHLTEELVSQLEQAGFLFYVMGTRDQAKVRLVTSWNTTTDDVDQFLNIVSA
ncbi:threonine aldolase family protein [Sneathiella sp.]|jgi:threonine aldolase|uniref:threonine aldolase family protein n=1 Tax=Sneathiella sp. TaxID=1964365 RepID=UPI0039E51ECA